MTPIPDENLTVSCNLTCKVVENIMVPNWSRILLIIYMLITGVLAASGNGIIILVERKNKCKTSTDWLVSCMAANDLAFAIINIPIHVVLQLGSWKSLGSDGLCKVHAFVEKWTVYSSTLLLCTVALDRYWKTCRPHDNFLTERRAFRVCILITAVSCLVCLPLLFMIVYVQPSNCTSLQNGGGSQTISAVLISLTFAIMFVIVCVCYTKVALTIKRKLIQNGLQIQKQDKTNKDSSENQPVANPTSMSVMSDTNNVRGKPLSRNCKVAPLNTKTNKAAFQDVNSTGNGQKDGLFDQTNSTVSTAVDSNPSESYKRKQTPLPVTTQLRNRRKLKDSRVDRTTKIMFAVTIVFLLSWLPTWIVVFYEQYAYEHETVAEEIFILFGNKAFMVNSFTNPIFYIWLSSVFKERAKKLLVEMIICRKQRN